LNNTYTLFGTSDIGHSFSEMESGYLPWENMQWYVDHSPLTYAKEIETPLLIIHSENDLRCLMEQAEQLFIALKNSAKTSASCAFPMRITSCHAAGARATAWSALGLFSTGSTSIFEGRPFFARRLYIDSPRGDNSPHLLGATRPCSTCHLI
jgi:hypothetical protein